MEDIRPRWQLLLRSLEHRNYRLYFIGQGISLLGTTMQVLAAQWLVYRLTLSPRWLGVIGFASQFPSFILAPLAGVLSDRWDRRRALLVTQSLAMLQALILAGLTAAGIIEVWEVALLSAFLGTVFVFDITSRQAFMSEIIDRKEDLGNAIALNSSLVTGSRLVGPMLATPILEATNEAFCFLLNALSFLAVLAALLLMRVAPRPPAVPRHLLQDVRAGWTFAFNSPPIRAVVALVALVSFAALPYSVLLPVFATKVLEGGERTFGALQSAAGFGALCGAVFLASRSSVLGLGRWIAIAPALLGAALIGFAFSTWLWLSLPMLFLVGFASMVQLASSNTILQTITDEDKRGRVLSFYTMAFMGAMPLGSLLAGELASRVGAPLTLCAGGIISLLGAAVFTTQLPALRQHVRPIYVRLGILTEPLALPEEGPESSLKNG